MSKLARCLLFISSFISLQSSSQNLVKNPSLEPIHCNWDFQSDPKYYQKYLKHWFIEEKSYSSLYISKCSVNERNRPPEFGIFHDNYQRVEFDSSHVSLAAGSFSVRFNERNGPNIWEWDYLNGNLKKQLKKDYIYVGAFYCNLMDFHDWSRDYQNANNEEISFYPVYYISHLDMRVADKHIIRDSFSTQYGAPIVAYTQVQNPRDRMLSDTMNFMEVKDTFVAKGNERVIQIGDFFPIDSVIGAPLCCTDTFKRYSRIIQYYIDGVSVFAYPDLPNDTLTICAGDSIAISPHVPPGTSFYWANGDSNQVNWVRQSGWVVCETHTRFSYAQDSVYVNVVSKTDKSFIINDTTICKDQMLNVALPNIGGLFITWSDNVQGFNRTLKNEGAYSYTVNGSNCTWQHSFKLIQDSLNINIGNDTTVCIDSKISLEVDAFDSEIKWSNGSSANKVSVGSGAHTVIVKRNGCVAYDTIQIGEVNYPWVNIYDTSLCASDAYKIDFNGWANYSFKWSNGSNASSFTTKEGGEYFVNVKTPCNEFTDSFNLEFINCNCELFIPNAITPNANGINEYFTIASNCSIKKLSIKVFNLWGQQIFESDDYQNNWSPQQLAMGNYFYLVNAELYNLKGEKTLIDTSGNLLLIK